MSSLGFMKIVVLAVSMVALAGCVAPDDASPGEDGATPPTSEPTIDPSAALQSLKPGPPSSLEGERLTGRLGFDDLEGGCGYLEADDGTRYEVIYPDGWQLRQSPLRLVSPDGEIVARGGDEVTVEGSVASEMASICQIGPIFQARAVIDE